jgi:hypothetical protein
MGNLSSILEVAGKTLILHKKGLCQRDGDDSTTSPILRRQAVMKASRSFMAQVSIQGVGVSSFAANALLPVTHVPGLKCYLCDRLVPAVYEIPAFAGMTE